MKITVTHIDTACMLLDVGGYRILTDPAFDAPGGFYHFGFGACSRKSSTPGIAAKDVGRVDLVLLSHDQHEDNLDREGRKVLARAPRILSTVPAARRIPGIRGLEDWESVPIATPLVPGLKVTAVPAQHAAFRWLNPISGKVVGFVLEWDGQKGGVYYISGDTVFFPGIAAIAARFPKIDVAFLHMGAVAFPYLSGPLRYTCDSGEAVRACGLLRPARAIPIHYEGWWHFREKTARAKARFAAAGLPARVLWLEPGAPAPLS